LSVSATINTMHSPATALDDRDEHVFVVKAPTQITRTKAAMNAVERGLHAAWLDWVESRAGETDTALARKAGFSENTLTRFRNREGAVLSGLTIRLISEYTGLPGPETYLTPAAAGFSEEAVAYTTTNYDDLMARMIREALQDRPNAAPWLLKSRAIAGAGYLPGDILIADAAILPMAGDVVCAQVYDLRHASAETVFRIYEPPYLISTSNETALRKPLPVDNDRVIVMGTVTQMFRGRRR
jgi:hypothetical protein